MKQEIEIEYKNLLTDKEFESMRLSEPFPEEGEKQINYYFETNNFSLFKNKCSLRIRNKNGAYVLTLKKPNDVGILETHHYLSKDEALAWIHGKNTANHYMTERLKKMNILIEDLKCFGCLATIRYELKKKSNAIVVLDYSTYNGCSDYELEVEAKENNVALHLFKSILEKYHIPRRKTLPKIARFFNTLKKK